MRVSVVESLLARIGLDYMLIDGCIVGDGGGDASLCIAFTTDQEMVASNMSAAVCTRYNAVLYDETDLHGMMTRVVTLLIGVTTSDALDMCYFKLVDQSTGYPTWCARQRMYRTNGCKLHYTGIDDSTPVNVVLMIAASVYIAVAAIFITQRAWSIYFDTTD